MAALIFAIENRVESDDEIGLLQCKSCEYNSAQKALDQVKPFAKAGLWLHGCSHCAWNYGHRI